MIRFIADLHIGDKGVAEKLRGLTVEEHDALIVENWNTVVEGFEDITYVLGDIGNDKSKSFWPTLHKLKGRVILIGGNHDNDIEELPKFTWQIMGCMEHEGYILTHIPVHPDEFTRWEEYGQVYKGNIHGHIHHHDVLAGIECGTAPFCYFNNKRIDGLCKECENAILYKDKRYFNVCCEKVNYTPLTLEEILKLNE